ncbi:hypothetical protein LUZ63_008515 [Rhynchospora breviuscula]|uniref:DUF4220 domain-containing protein n=1 Tax=Rhynchospora breviuscula TaxID=2022672 RepID=A0A9Q0HW46_9POAL|nr:hypothetical protein LUZ63_008515 [Rhynchospora breviuscula]
MLQIVLISCAPLQKQSRDKRLLFLLWLAYLGADYVATLALGSILTNTFQNAGVDLPEQSLIAFWAPFLLLHLGGPDNITSYSIEDNELWLRHFLGFVVQTSVALLVLVQATLHTTRLLVIIWLTWSAQDTNLNEETLDISDAKFILKAYIYFLVFKPHIVGTFATYPSYVFHMGVHKVDRDFKFIGIELSFFYNILHTKATVVHRNTCRVIRITSLVSTATALVFFHISEKGGYEKGVEVSDVLEKIVIKHVENLFKTWTSYGDLLRKIRSSWINNTLDKYNLTEIKDIMNRKEFDECVMVWHMATETCYFASNNVPADSEEGRMREAMYRISQYMMYLLVERSSMMPPGIAETRKVETIRMGRHMFHNSHHVRQACIFIYAKGRIKRSRLSLSVIPLVSLLVKNLKEIAETSEEQQWEIIRDAWMEMLTFAAVHCSPTEHARGLSRGGEFLTHYWLLLAHYGIMEDYNASELLWRLATEIYIEIWTRESEPYC